MVKLEPVLALRSPEITNKMGLSSLTLFFKFFKLSPKILVICSCLWSIFLEERCIFVAKILNFLVEITKERPPLKPYKFFITQSSLFSLNLILAIWLMATSIDFYLQIIVKSASLINWESKIHSIVLFKFLLISFTKLLM